MRTQFLLTLLICFFSFGLQAKTESGINVLPSVEWQKIQLEETIQQRYEKLLSPVLKSGEYSVLVNITTVAPQKPNFIKDNKSKNKGKIKFSTELPEEGKGDYLVFSKLGLEVPLIEDHKTKENLTSQLEEMWDYNESVDLFKNIDAIDVTISLSNGLLEPTRASIQKMLDNSRMTLGEIEPQVNLQYVDMKEGFEATFLDKMLPILMKFSTAIGIILAAFILGLMGLMMLKKYASLAKPGEGTSISINNNIEKGDDDKAGASAPAAALGEMMGDGILDAIERFKAFFESNRDDASNMIKKWIRSGEERAQLALKVLVQKLDNSLLSEVLGLLTLDDREEWRSLLDTKGLGSGEIQKGENYIASQILDLLIAVPAGGDAEVQELLMSLTPPKAVSLLQDKPNLAGALLNMVHTTLVTRILEGLDADQSAAATRAALNFDFDTFGDIVDELKEGIRAHTSKKKRSPFVDKIISLVPEALPSREVDFYGQLAEVGEVDAVGELAHEHLPAHLVAKLPEDFLKDLLTRYSLDKKSELFMVLEDELKDQFLQLYAPDGSNVRDVLNLEFKKIERDTKLHKDIQARKEMIWREFVHYARAEMKANTNFTEEFDFIVDEWLESFGVQSKTEKPDLKLVA